MQGSLQIARVSGIKIYLHWTFLILLIWLLILHVTQGHTLGVALEGIIFILALFSCIILHELGHALTAKHYGVKTRDITLYPIGGVARLEKIPRNPTQELWIALAGPAVNVVIAGVIALILAFSNHIPSPESLSLIETPILPKLMWVNLVLVIFNLLPAFPMDGGRVLRSILARITDYNRATRIAARTGQVMAVFFGFIGLFFNPFLLFIALFVYIGAQAELYAVEMHSTISGLTARDGMLTRFRTLSPQDSIRTAANELLAGSQQDFPVVGSEGFMGILTRRDLVRALSEGLHDMLIGEVIHRTCPRINITDRLENIIESLQQPTFSTLPVFEQDRLVGLINLENIGELMMIQSATKK